MFSKRRSIKSGGSVTSGNTSLQGEGEYCDIIHVQRPHCNKAFNFVTTPKRPVAVLHSTPSSTGGMDDLSLTSPTVHEPVESTIKTLKRKRDVPMPERTLSSTVRRLTAKPGTSKGSEYNPIVLEEYSPRRKPPLLPKRVGPAQEPHKFRHRHRKTYVSRPTRPPLKPKPANGSTFTGDKGSDLYRAINAKATVVPWNPPPTQAHVGYGVPFEVQYPMSAQYLALKPATTGPYQSPYARHHHQMGVSLNGDSEDMLRKEVRQYSHILSDDSYTTKSSTAHPRPSNTDPTSSTTPSRKKLRVYKDDDTHDLLLTTLVAQSSLLTSLLQIYPKSKDQKGLRADIASLVGAQKQRVDEWTWFDTCFSNASGDSSVRQRDDEVRSFLSAAAGMWQDGSGEGVADVFTDHAEESETSEEREGGKRVDEDVRSV
jgi:hypothetical protein